MLESTLSMDPDFLRYLVLALSVSGLLKASFLATTVFTAPPAYTSPSDTLSAALIEHLEEIRDGFHAFATAINIASAVLSLD